MPLPLPTSTAASIFANLQGKQVWHVTAPANVPLSELRQISVDKALSGELVTQHDGVEYGFAVRASDGEKKDILLPHGGGFKAAGVDISRTLHLQQMIRLPNLSSRQADINTGSEAASSITRSTIRAPRPQVKGLRMRFMPSGFGDEDPGMIGSSDSEMDVSTHATARLSTPNGRSAATKTKKRKHEAVNAEEKSASPVKKHKKHKTPEEKEQRRKEKKRQKEAAKAK
jgi:hypothetical protein